MLETTLHTRFLKGAQRRTTTPMSESEGFCQIAEMGIGNASDPCTDICIHSRKLPGKTARRPTGKPPGTLNAHRP